MLSEVLQMTLVRTEGCHLCDDAESLLRDATADGAVNLEVVTADSARGRALIAEHRPALFPLVLADGRFFCADGCRAASSPDCSRSVPGTG